MKHLRMNAGTPCPSHTMARLLATASQGLLTTQVTATGERAGNTLLAAIAPVSLDTAVLCKPVALLHKSSSDWLAVDEGAAASTSVEVADTTSVCWALGVLHRHT